MKTLRRVGDFLLPHRVTVVVALALTGGACLLNLIVPLLIQGLVDHVISGDGAAWLPLYAAGLALGFASAAGLGLGSTLLMGRVGLDVVRDLRHRLYARLQRLSLSYYDKTPAGAIISRLTDDVSAVQALLTNQTLTVLTDVGTAVAVSILLLLRWPLLFAVVLVCLPPYIVIFHRFTRGIRGGSAAVRQRLDTVFGHLKAKLDGMLVVKAHAREEAEAAEFTAQIDAAHAPRLQVGRLGAAFSVLTVATSGVGASLVFATGAFQALAGRMTPGEVVSAAALAGLLFGPVARLADLASVFETAGTSLRRLGEILDQESDVPEPADPVPLGRAKGRVEFQGVGFGYDPGRLVLQDANLRIEPGMKVALVGPTGCGKTTLMSLLLRFYDPARGEIRLDGIPLPRLAVADLRRQVGVVPQEPVVFRASLADNIRYGAPDADEARVEASARAALVHHFARALPQGYATLVGEGAHRLSQGERQRIAIARAFCKDPALVILDEATSSLDTPSESLIRSALANLLRGRTAFIIAHRLSTVLDADLIVVMEDSRIIQAGTHADLLADVGGLYRRLCSRQLSLLKPPADALPAPPPLAPRVAG